MKGRPFLRLAILASLLLCAGIAVPVAATDVTYANQTIVISGPGLYVLKNDIVNCNEPVGVQIAASNVVFDGGGHLVDGTGGLSSKGINVSAAGGARNVTVRNVRVREWDFGVYLDGAVNSRIESSSLQDNLLCGAVLYRNASANTVAGCTVTGNGYGIMLSGGAADCTVSGNRIEGNGCGLYLYGSDRVTVTRNVIAANTEAGVQCTLCGGGTVYDNRFENADNVVFPGGPPAANAWSVTPRDGPNVLDEPSIGGNYWGRPDGTGFSEVTADGDGDGFSDAPLELAPQNVDFSPLAPSIGFDPVTTPTPEPPETPLPTPVLPPGSPTPGAVVPGGAGLPTDTNGDGRYEDVNGNGRKDFADVVLFFNQLAWIAGQSPISFFDYNANGRIDFADVVTLFTNL